MPRGKPDSRFGSWLTSTGIVVDTLNRKIIQHKLAGWPAVVQPRTVYTAAVQLALLHDLLGRYIDHSLVHLGQMSEYIFWAILFLEWSYTSGSPVGAILEKILYQRPTSDLPLSTRNIPATY